MIFWQAIYSIWRREIIRYWRTKTRMVSSLFQPIMFLIIFGAGLQRTLAQGDFGIDFIQFMYPGIIAMGVMGTAFFSTVSTVWDREFGFLKEILVAPVPRLSISIGKALGATTIATLQGLILLVIAPVVGVQLSFGTVVGMIGVLLLLSLAIAGMGLLIASLMKSTESFGFIMQFMIFPMFFVSGAFFPLTQIPFWMRWVANINPLTYGVDALRQIVLGSQVAAEVLQPFVLHSITFNTTFLAAFSAVMLSLAVVAFERRA